jgi:hypothetical protein
MMTPSTDYTRRADLDELFAVGQDGMVLTQEQLAKMLNDDIDQLCKAMDREAAKVMRCRRLNIRHKNRLPQMRKELQALRDRQVLNNA